jgi:4-amino-4-deoxy-L-arabinose transferase-like glycosyltransferase
VTRRPRVPAALGALLAVSALMGVVWTCVVPAFQAPDEQSHFAYVQSLGARHALPGDTDRPAFSTQMQQGIDAVNSNQVAAQLQVDPEWSDQVERRWLATQARAASDDGGGPNLASTYPPTAYAWEAIGYEAASSGTVFDELLGARLMSALWIPVTVLATWLLAGEVFGRRRALQTATAAVPALLPMFAFIASSVSPDGMMYALWTLALWLGVRCVRRGVPLADGAAFFAVVGLACTVKTTSYALLPAALLVAVLGLLARRPWRIGGLLRLAAAIVVPLAVTLGAWVVGARAGDRAVAAQITESSSSGATAGTNWRELLSYVWQYYLPRLPFQQRYTVPPGGYPLLQVWITQAWGAFGWLEVKFPPWVYRVLGVLTMSVFAGGLAALMGARRQVEWRVVAFVALVFLALLGGLHWTDYHQLESGTLGFMQGRYMFPAIGIFGLALGGAVSLLPERRHTGAAGAAIGALLVFHLFALGLVIDRFYA